MPVTSSPVAVGIERTACAPISVSAAYAPAARARGFPKTGIESGHRGELKIDLTNREDCNTQGGTEQHYGRVQLPGCKEARKEAAFNFFVS